MWSVRVQRRKNYDMSQLREEKRKGQTWGDVFVPQFWKEQEIAGRSALFVRNPSLTAAARALIPQSSIVESIVLNAHLFSIHYCSRSNIEDTLDGYSTGGYHSTTV